MTRCPNCDTATIPVAYGYPSFEMFEDARSGTIALGGCVIGSDDPKRCCPSCKAAVWSHGVFSTGHGLRVRLGLRADRFEASLPDEGPLWVCDAEGTVVTIDRADVELVALVSAVELFDDGTRLARWLRHRGLSSTGEVVGPIDRIIVEADGSLRVSSGDESLTVHDGRHRLVIHLLRDIIRVRRLNTVSDLVAWLEDLGLEIGTTVRA